jgi:hypothetical protein
MEKTMISKRKKIYQITFEVRPVRRNVFLVITSL